MIGNQHSQYHSDMHQVPEASGMFCSSGSPMWGNQNQNGNMYHNLSQPSQHQQQLHNHQLHVRQQAQQQHHHPCYQAMELQHRMRQQQSHHQPLLTQHQQLNTHTIPLQQHHNFSFHQGSHSQSHQQLYHTQPQVHQQLNRPRFQSRALKSYVDTQSASLSSTCLQAPQQQQQCNYQMTGSGQTYSGPGPEDHNVLFPMQSSSMGPPLPTRSVGSVTAYQPAQFSSYSAEPELPGLSHQVLPSVSRPTTSAPLTCTMPELSGPGSQFPSTDMMSQQHIRGPARQPEECPFQGLRCSGEAQRNLKSSDMFGKSMSCYSDMASPLPSEQPQSCVATSVNGYQALGDSLLSSGAHDGDLDDLEPPDLLPDLLPQLEAALTQQNETKCSWTASSQERGHEHRKPPPEEYNEEVGNVMLHSCVEVTA